MKAVDGPGRSAPVRTIALQRQIKIFPLFEVTEAAFSVREVGLVVTPLVVLDELQNRLGGSLGIRQTPVNQLSSLRQRQGWGFFLYLCPRRSRNNWARDTRRV